MIKKNIEIVHNNIKRACDNSSRKPEEITLVAVSKQNSVEAINEAYKTGITNFGENKDKELREKYNQCKQDISWHFIGHLQTNKVKNVVPFAELIHSVDSLKLIREIEKRSKTFGKSQRILIEVNTSGEESKFGLWKESEIIEIVDYGTNSENIDVLGLMTMAPFTNDKEIVRGCFKSLKKIFIKLNDQGYNLSELSMGMTNDYEIAIEEGATILRIGTAIFKGK